MTATTPSTTRSFASQGWVVVLGCFISLIASSTAISFYVRGLFLGPLVAEFGWSRAAFSLGASVSSIAGAAAAVIAGPLADRWGVRRILLPGILLYALATASFALLTGSFTQYLLFSLVLGPFVGIQSPLLYGKVISQWIDRRRGLALALALMGTAVGSVVIPPLAQAVIADHGWRAAYVMLGCIVAAVSLPATWLLVREPVSVGSGSVRKLSNALSGLDARQVLRSQPGFWCFTAAIGLNSMAVNGLVVHLLPLLKDRGNTLGMATSAVAAVAVAQIAGRFASGFLLDRIQTPRIGILWFASIAAGIAAIMASNTPAAIYLGAALCGLGLGAELELGNYIVSRLYGLKGFGQLFAIVYAVYVLGVAAGGYLMGLSFDRTGSYQAALIGMEAAIGVGALLMLFVEPYRFLPRPAAASQTDQETQ